MDIEDRIRGYRPSGPPADVRRRVLDAPARPIDARSRGMLEWVPAMAAAAAAVIFALLAQRAEADVNRRTADVSARHAEAVSTLRDALGGSDMARAEAERIISEAEQRMTTDTQAEPAGHE